MGFLSRLFRRPPQVIDRRNMNEDWRRGDLAVCIVEPSEWVALESGPPPEKGAVYRVTRVCDDAHVPSHIRCFWLSLESIPGFSYECVAFRKVIIDHKAADADFTAKIKGRKPVKVRA